MVLAFSGSVDASIVVEFISGGVVVVGIVLEGAELLVKFGRKRKYRIWIGEIFGNERRRRLVSWVKYIKPRILPFEALGFSMIVVGLTVEWISGTTAAVMQSRENGILESTNMQLSLRVEELRRENNDFAIAQEPRKIDPFALEQALEKTHGINFILVNIPDWEANTLAAGMEWSFESEYTLFREYRHWTYSRIVTALDIPDGVHVGFPTPPNPFNQLPAILTREDRARVDEKAVKSYMDFEPSKESVEAGEILGKALGASGIAVNNWGQVLDEEANKVLSKLGISTQTVPTNTVVILIGHKPDPKTISLRKMRQKAVGVQLDPKSSAADVSNAWHAVFVFEEEYRQRQIILGLWPTNAPHSIFSPTGWNGDGSPVAARK